MAVARMLRVTAIGHQAIVDETVDRLQRSGTLQVTEGEDLPCGSPVLDETAAWALEEQIARVDFVTDFLARFRESDARFSTFVSEKVHLTEEEFRSLEYDEAFEELYDETESISGRLAAIGRERERLLRLVEDLGPWNGLRLEIQQWIGTEHVALFTGTVPANRGPEIRQQLREEVRELSIEELGVVGPRQAWVVMVYRDHEEDVRSLLALAGFEEVAFPGLTDYPAEEAAKAHDTLTDLDTEEGLLLERASELTEMWPDAVALGEALRSRHVAITVRSGFGSTDRAFVICGWLPASRRRELERAIGELEHVDLAFEELRPDDDPPVLLENPRWLKPFEVITDLYGRPRYGELDPTPTLFAWFFFFFGICLGDFGYGVGLIAVAWLIKHKLDVADGVKRFMDLLMYGGLASGIVGVFTGSYFALDPELLPSFLSELVVLDPLTDVSTALIFSVVLGLFHVNIGVSIRAWRRTRQGYVMETAANEGSALLLWPALAFLIVGLSLGANPLEIVGFTIRPEWLTWGGLALLAIIALLQGRVFFPPYGIRNFFGLFIGVYRTYESTIGHVSDFLSYTRLAALGMASVLVGRVMNILAELMFDSIKIAVVAAILAAVVFCIGHAFNLAISLLGAFVHPLRLQFVEYFSKFYEGGGRNYAPFEYGTKSLVLRRESARKRGG